MNDEGSDDEENDSSPGGQVSDEGSDEEKTESSPDEQGSTELDTFLLRVAGAHDSPGAEPMRAVTKGTVVDDRYRILGRLGEGGMGSVFAAERTDGSGAVALKLIRARLGADTEMQTRFSREALSVLQMSHRHIVRALDSGVWDDRPYLVMELLEGETLRQRLRRAKGPLPPPLALDLFRGIIDAVSYAHGQGVVHRDLKPENVFLTGKDDRAHPFVLDFGLAKVPGTAALTMSGVSFGTPLYMAPEQLREARSAGPASDQYSLGVMLFEALAGDLPFPQRVLLRLAEAKEHPPPLPDDVGSVVGEPVAAALHRAMMPLPQDRHASLGDLYAALYGEPAPSDRLPRARP
ncbi:MAG: serine/threonine-protein kinase [Sandaracinaceae bacterium]